jgi:hypothetical protein
MDLEKAGSVLSIALWGMRYDANAHVFGLRLAEELNRLGYTLAKKEPHEIISGSL